MREIKFRAWSNNEMETSSRMPDHSFWKWVSYDSDTKIMEYAGFEDKNNVQMFEGDILEGDNSVIYVIDFDRGCFIAKVAGYFRGDKQEWDKGYPLKDFELLSIKIIGNIYQNPDLL